jgi:hypothetical protein
LMERHMVGGGYFSVALWKQWWGWARSGSWQGCRTSLFGLSTNSSLSVCWQWSWIYHDGSWWWCHGTVGLAHLSFVALKLHISPSQLFLKIGISLLPMCLVYYLVDLSEPSRDCYYQLFIH